MTNGFGSGVMKLDQGNKPPTNELGSFSAWQGGYTPQWAVLQAMDELETNPKLTFPESIYTYHAMRTDPQIQGLLTGAIWPLLRMQWYIDPNGARKELVDKISTDYNLPIFDPAAPPPIPDPVTGQLPPNPFKTFQRRPSQGRFNFLEHLETAMEAIAYGFEVFEQVGYIGDDGLWHLKKLALRPAQTITEIHLTQNGDIEYVRQANLIDQPLPIDRLVVYPFQKRGANWHGRSLLRGCYAPWLLKDRAERVGVMNIQRAGVGVPVAQGHPGATQSDLEVLSQMAQKLMAGDRSGGAIPYGATLRLIGVEGGQPDTVAFVKLMNEEMARSFFQMFMQLGQTTSGSRALGETFVEYHKLVTEYLAEWFAGIFNEHVIEDDIDWNYGPDEEFVPILQWRWDDKTETNPQLPAGQAKAVPVALPLHGNQPITQNPSKQMQEAVQEGTVQTAPDTKAMILGE